MSTTVHPEGRAVSYSTYLNQGCRCDGCRAAYSVYQKARRAQHGRVPADGRPLKRQRDGVGDWADEAACKGRTHVMFPTDSTGVEIAKTYCARCPVTEECLEHALSNGETKGVWGGKSERERTRIQRARRTA